MSKSIWCRWFGLRKVPAETRTRLTSEGILFDEEGISCSMSFRKFSGPRNYSSRGYKSHVIGTLVITKKTFYVHLPFMILCDQPMEHAVQHVQADLDGPYRLVMQFQVEELFERATGQMSCTWRTDKAWMIREHLRKLQSRRTAGH